MINVIISYLQVRKCDSNDVTTFFFVCVFNLMDLRSHFKKIYGYFADLMFTTDKARHVCSVKHQLSSLIVDGRIVGSPPFNKKERGEKREKTLLLVSPVVQFI